MMGSTYTRRDKGSAAVGHFAMHHQRCHCRAVLSFARLVLRRKIVRVVQQQTALQCLVLHIGHAVENGRDGEDQQLLRLFPYRHLHHLP